MAEQTKKISIDGQEHNLDDLSDTAKIIAGFLNKIDTEAKELKYQLDKAMLARKQAMTDLQTELEKD